MMDNKQAAEAMPPGEFQKVPEICNCQEPKCRKRVDAAIEAMREAAARECDGRADEMRKRFLWAYADAHGRDAKAIRALKVEEVLK